MHARLPQAGAASAIYSKSEIAQGQLRAYSKACTEFGRVVCMQDPEQAVWKILQVLFSIV